MMMICYTLVCWSINKDRLEDDGSNCVKEFNQHIRMISMLAIAYSLCVCPAIFQCWRQFDIKSWFSTTTLQQHVFKSCLNLLYWSMYSINFILYMCSYNRIREAYKRFFRDSRDYIWSRESTNRSSILQNIANMVVNDI